MSKVNQSIKTVEIHLGWLNKLLKSASTICLNLWSGQCQAARVDILAPHYTQLLCQRCQEHWAIEHSLPTPPLGVGAIFNLHTSLVIASLLLLLMPIKDNSSKQVSLGHCIHMRHSYIKPCILPSPPESSGFYVQPGIVACDCCIIEQFRVPPH